MRIFMLLCFLVLLPLPAAAEDRDYPMDVGELRIMAEHGDAGAQYALGVRYNEGRGVKKDDAEAAKWIRKAAGLCHEEALAALGMLYFTGEGVKQDQAEALQRFLPLAAAGRGEVQIGVAAMYLEGQGTAKNPAEAYFWTLLAAKELEDGAALRDQIKPRLSPEEIKAAQKRADAWKPTPLPCAAETADDVKK